MRVMKFGGTSLATLDRIETVLQLVSEAVEKEPVAVVVSAVAGVTDHLQRLGDGNTPPSPSTPGDLLSRHLSLCGPDAEAKKELRPKLEAILRILKSPPPPTGPKGCRSPKDKDQILAVGERLASNLLASLLQSRGVRAQAVPGSDIVRTDSTFGSAVVHPAGTRHLARWTLGRIETGVVPVIAGFTGGDEEGRTTTLGRGSSDLTATLVAEAVSARLVEIWTDVGGVFDRDPNRWDDAEHYTRLTYSDARDLAKNGAKVLHPRTLDPIEDSGIPLRVRSTLTPEAPGTWIVPEDGGEGLEPEDGGAAIMGHHIEEPVPSGRISLILAGATGGVGRTFLSQLKDVAPALQREGIDVRVAGAFSTRLQLWDREGVPLDQVHENLSAGSAPDWAEVARRLSLDPPGNPVFVDCTASREVSDVYPLVLSAGAPVVTPNKLAWSGSQAQYDSLREASRMRGLPSRYETTVGAALPILRTVRDLREAGDGFRDISGVLSGTLSFVFSKLGEGVPFSRAVAEARELGFTEPHPREDLTGADVARKLLILLREAGFEWEPEYIPVESLVPTELLGEGDPERFLEGLKAFDGEWAERIRRAGEKPLSYVAWFDGEEAGVGVRALPSNHPLASLRPTENMVVLKTDRYPEVPLTIGGPGAGREVTASGVLADFLATIHDRYGREKVA